MFKLEAGIEKKKTPKNKQLSAFPFRSQSCFPCQLVVLSESEIKSQISQGYLPRPYFESLVFSNSPSLSLRFLPSDTKFQRYLHILADQSLANVSS